MIKQNKGFTLIEILVVIGIIAILATVVLIAINPSRQFAQAHNSQRTSNLNAILNAIGQNIADNKGKFTCGTVAIPSTGTAVTHPITSTPSSAKNIADATSDSTGVDLGCLSPTYMSALPFDPTASGALWTSAATYNTKYYVIKDDSTTGGGRITVFAPSTELGTDFLEVTR